MLGRLRRCFLFDLADLGNQISFFDLITDLDIQLGNLA